MEHRIFDSHEVYILDCKKVNFPIFLRPHEACSRGQTMFRKGGSGKERGGREYAKKRGKWMNRRWDAKRKRR